MLQEYRHSGAIKNTTKAEESEENLHQDQIKVLLKQEKVKKLCNN